MNQARKRLGALTAALALVVLASFAGGQSDGALHVVPVSHAQHVEVAAAGHPAAPATSERLFDFPNNYMTWACGATRGSEEDVLLHAHPKTLTPEYLYGTCQSQAEDLFCTWGAYLWWNGATTAVNRNCGITG